MFIFMIDEFSGDDIRKRTWVTNYKSFHETAYESLFQLSISL